jgi:NDP-sugar pyrophosphorylase family protein
MKDPILVVLAAGMGSRYGGLKQMDKLGSNGEALLDYSVFDALRSGFKKIIFIIRHDIEEDFREIVLARMGSAVPYSLAFQDLDSLIPPDIYREVQRLGRTKPWGTSHALLCAADQIDAPFAVINADDFYGHPAYTVLGNYLSTLPLADAAIVPYRLEPTLSPQGSVARGICGVKEGFLLSVEELLSIKKEGDTIHNLNPDGTRRELAPDTLVSMNFWGFPETILPEFQKYFDEFIASSYKDIKSECYIPRAADHFIKRGIIRIRSLPANSEWFGVTYKDDKAAAVRRIAELTAEGVYPAKLW